MDSRETCEDKKSEGIIAIPNKTISDSSRTTFKIDEATIEEIQLAFQRNELTSKELVQYYLDAIERQKDILFAVIEVNPDALALAEKADNDRKLPGGGGGGMLQGIPVLLKDNIATKDKLNTTAGSYALLGSTVPRDAEVVYRLRQAGAIILGKAGLSEWSNSRSSRSPGGWSARGGTVQNPYVLELDAGGSSTGSAVSVATNLVTVSLGTETNGSILSPSAVNCVVGIKPTVGLTSRSGVIPFSLRQDSVGPIGRTVSDAVHVLDAIVGFDPTDQITKEASKFIPSGGYKQFLKIDGLKGKRLGRLLNYSQNLYSDNEYRAFLEHCSTFRRNGADVIDVKIPDIRHIESEIVANMGTAVVHELKRDLNIYLSNLPRSEIRTLADIIAYNRAHPEEEKLDEYGQDGFEAAEDTTLPNTKYEQAIEKLDEISKEVFEKLINDYKLDAVVAPPSKLTLFFSIGGYPAISVPAGFEDDMPLGILFGGLKGSEAKLIEIAYTFEQATKLRKPPPKFADK